MWKYLVRLSQVVDRNDVPTPWERITRIFLLLVIVAGMLSVLLSTFSYMEHFRLMFSVVSYFAGAVFTVEYLLRLVLAHSKGNLLRYVLSFLGIVDFFSILPFVLPYFFPHDSQLSGLIIFARMFLIFKLVRYSSAFEALGEVIRSVRTQLWLSISIPAIFTLFSAVLVYFVEKKAQPEVFQNIGDSLWWAIITMTTTGYGDIYPITTFGRIVGGLTALIGVFIIALPTGIISSAFMQRMSWERKLKRATKVTLGSRSEQTHIRKTQLSRFRKHPQE